VKRILKVISFGILPIITLISFTIIGKINEREILAKEGSHHTMTGIISSTAWAYRGIYAMVLIIVFSFVLYSKLSKTVKVFVFMLMLILNLPVMYFMELAIYLPLGLIIIPVVNLIALIPAFAKQIHN
jgi:hypothetical protein